MTREEQIQKLIESLWHDIEEEPDYSPQIIYQDKSGFCYITSRQEICAYDWEWQRCAADFQMVRCAYINDLLPKNLVTWQKLIH